MSMVAIATAGVNLAYILFCNRMSTTAETPPLITPQQLESWILHEDDDYLVVNKPGWVVCHPSKNGPWSSLVGAVREHYRIESLHLVSRLDRETSGVVVLARNKSACRPLQKALQQRSVHKRYLAIVAGALDHPLSICQPLRGDDTSPVRVKLTVGFSRTAKSSQTLFKPLEKLRHATVVEAVPISGRKHQIRIHAQWAGHPIIGDKLYSGDDSLYLEFVTSGWSERLAQSLPMPRQALHAAAIEFRCPSQTLRWEAPVPTDMLEFIDSQRLHSEGI